MKIHDIPGKLETSWLDDVKAVLDTWTSYDIALPDFRQAVLVDGVDYAKAHGGVAWIVDSSAATGAFSAEIQAFIGSDVFPGFAKAGIKYFVTITSKVSLAAKKTVASYSAQTGPHGLKLVEVDSVSDAKEWLKANPA
jgi:hypothetical protein